MLAIVTSQRSRKRVGSTRKRGCRDQSGAQSSRARIPISVAHPGVAHRSRVIELERRARASAQQRGKGEELAGVEAPIVAQEVSSEDSDNEAPDGGTEKPSTGDADSATDTERG